MPAGHQASRCSERRCLGLWQVPWGQQLPLLWLPGASQLEKSHELPRLQLLSVCSVIGSAEMKFGVSAEQTGPVLWCERGAAAPLQPCLQGGFGQVPLAPSEQGEGPRSKHSLV